MLVTGGAGFVGSHVVDALRAAGQDVRVLDARTGADIRDADAVERALDGVDHVCHQAGMVGLGVDFLDVADYVSHNDLGTAVLLRALARRRFRGRLVLASSMVVYGEGHYRCATHGPVRPRPRRAADLDAGRFEPRCPRCGAELAPEAIGEDAPTDPRNVYAATKLHQEHLAFAYARETGAPVTALRYHNVYGPRMPRDTPYAGVAAIFAGALAAGRAPTGLRGRRPAARLRPRARRRARQPRGAAGARAGAGRLQRVLGHAAQRRRDGARAARRARRRRRRPSRSRGEYRLGDVRHVFASAALAADRLGFIAREDFATGMAELADEHRVNPARETASAQRATATLGP